MITEPQDRQSSPSEAFVKQVKDALKYLYDFPHLQNHPLAQAIGSADLLGEPPGQQLRRDIISAIESQSPGPSTPFHSPQARLYNLLHLHYVEGMTIQEVAHELGLSPRQAYRDLRRGEEGVAAVLWARRPASTKQAPVAGQPSSIQAEIARLDAPLGPTDVHTLLRRAQEAVERMATQRSMTLDIAVSPNPVVILTVPAIAQQVLVNILSHAIQQARPGILRIMLKSTEEQAYLTVHYSLEPNAASEPAITLVATQLMDKLGWTVSQENLERDTRAITLRVPIHGPTLLVVDDNEGLVELLERYLTEYACRIVAALSGHEGLRLSRELHPDVIVLDIMMPEMDGWELLQRIRTHPQTANIPVIICSVFDDPELAYSLGASLFLAKPVSQDNVVDALRQLGMI